MRHLSRRRTEGPGRSAANRWSAASLYRPATHLHSEWIERRHCRGPDEESGCKPFRGRHYLDLGVPGVAPAAVNLTPILPNLCNNSNIFVGRGFSHDIIKPAKSERALAPEDL